jgi:TP901 family phage tail tape measure protein
MIGLGRFSSLGIGLAVSLVDNFTANAARVNNAMRNLATNQRALVQTGNAMQYSGMAATGAMIAMAIPLSRAVKTAAEFQYTMSGVKAATELGTEAMEKMNKKAMELGANTIFSAKQVAEGMYMLSKAGLTGAQVYESIGGVTSLAAATDVSLSMAGDFVAKLKNAFQLPASEIGRVGDILAMATFRSSTDMEHMSAAIKYTMATSAGLGMSLEETTAGIATIASMGMATSMGGTSMENFLRYLTRVLKNRPAPEDAIAMRNLGLSRKDFMTASGGIKDLSTIIESLRDPLSKLGTVDQLNTLITLFGVRGHRGGRALINAGQGGEGYSVRDMQNMLTYESTGYSDRIAKERQNNLYGWMEKMQESFITLGIAIGNALTPMLIIAFKAIRAFNEALATLVSTRLGKWLSTAIVGWVAWKGILGIVSFTLGGIMKLMASGVIAQGSFMWNLVNGFGRLNLSGRLFVGILGKIRRLLMASPLLISLLQGRFNSAGSLTSSVTGRFATLGGLLAQQAMRMIKPLWDTLKAGVTGFMALIARGGAALLGMLGPVGGVIAALVALAGLIWAFVKFFKKDKGPRLSAGDAAYLEEIRRIKAVEKQQTYDPKTGQYRLRTQQELDAMMAEAFAKSYNLLQPQVDLAGNPIKGQSNPTVNFMVGDSVISRDWETQRRLLLLYINSHIQR